jgi:adenylate cyclase
MGDAVNVASRLEGANKYYGTTIVASEMTVALTGSKFAWRELDAVRVRGRSGPVRSRSTNFSPRRGRRHHCK